VEIREYQPTMYHCKVLIADEAMVSVGSTNFDNRSFRLNDEASLNIYDEQFARTPGRGFRARLQPIDSIDLRTMALSPVRREGVEHAAALLGPSALADAFGVSEPNSGQRKRCVAHYRLDDIAHRASQPT
jgi:cardiolipin synthase